MQLSLYDLMPSDDPLFNDIKQLEKGGSLEINLSGGKALITHNFMGIYEFSNDNYHECFKDYRKCYKFVNTIINNMQFNLLSKTALM